LQGGEHFITNNKANGTMLESVLTIANVDKNDLGQYYCKAQYIEPAYIEIIGKDPITLSFTGKIQHTDSEYGKRVEENWNFCP
jgi:hypothetical protein